MNKAKRSLIISSAIMVVALIVAIVGVSAAWFGDSRLERQGGFIIKSDTLQDAATIDISSAKGMSGECVYPAVAENGYLLGGATQPTTGVPLKTDSAGQWQAARCATVYFPVVVIGTPDSGYETENRKSLDLDMRSANIGRLKVTTASGTDYYERSATITPGEGEKLDNYAGVWSKIGKDNITFNGKGSGSVGATAITYTCDNDTETITFTASSTTYSATLVNYRDEFNVEMCLVEANLDSDGIFESEKSVIPTAANYSGPLGNAIFYQNYGYHLYMLVQPGVTCYVKVVIYFNKLDEECNLDLLNTVVRFNFKLNILADGSIIRERTYAA